jgi:AAA domain
LTLRLRYFQLRAKTSGGLYGTDISFGPGLTVIWANNTKGKSTCMQGMLYALGMERMLSPRREIPLPHAMTSYVETDNKTQHTVLESNVSLEIENGAGQIITVHRPVKSQLDNRLISVDLGPTLTDKSIQAPRRNFFVSDPGAALREDGFHHFLEDFLGWELPTVRRYDAPDGKLYLETVFPLFWVEQKAGWSSIPAAIPTYLRIREVHKRAVEFIMDLDVYRLELRRQQIADLLARNNREWRVRLDEAEGVARRSGGKTEGLPLNQTAIENDLNKAHVVLPEKSGWSPLRDFSNNLRRRVAELLATPVLNVGVAAEDLTRKLQLLIQQAEIINADRVGTHNTKQIKDADIASLERRIKSLAEDLRKNQDVQKLQRYSGSVADLTPDHCPTCEQSLIDTLLTQEALTAVMPIEDNIEYIRSQLRMFEDIFAREKEALRSLDQTIAHADRELTDLYSQIRTIRTDLVSPNTTPSASAVEERVRVEARINELDGAQYAFDDVIEHLKKLSHNYANLLAEQAVLPKDKMSEADKRKIDRLTVLIRQQAKEFGFSTFDPNDVTISEDTYRPQKEGFEIGFETSASDAIRLKWAYQLGLLELAVVEATHHPGLLLFDEPRQQSSARVSFESLLRRAAAAKRHNQQVIFSTSEDLPSLQRATATLDCEEHIFSGYMINAIQ